MDKGAQFVIENFEKAKELTKNAEYKNLKKKVEYEFNLIKGLKRTGDAYEYFLKYSNYSHQYADDFRFLDDYGLVSNEKMSEYLLKHYPDEIENKTTIDDFKVCETYTNSEIYLFFRGFRSGIRYNPDKNAIAIITSEDSLYNDYWDGDIFYYTGEGQNGDQRINSYGNKSLLSTNNKGTKIYLFDKLSSNKYYYYGEVYLAGSIKTEKRKDEQGNLREVIIFPLKLVNQNTKFIFKGEDRKEVEKEINDKIESISKERLHEIAKSKKPQRIKKITTSERVERDPIVAKDTKNRANGKCDLCGNDAPFVTENGPFLESHHVITIAEGGPDVIYNTVALCPNCHRRIHNLKDPKDYERLVKVLYNYLLSDEDKENLKNWEKLFN